MGSACCSIRRLRLETRVFRVRSDRSSSNPVLLRKPSVLGLLLSGENLQRVVAVVDEIQPSLPLAYRDSEQ